MSAFVISQIFVGIAICTDIISFQFKEKVHIVSCLLVSCILISLHFMLLGRWTAACLGLLAAARFVVSVFSTRKLYRNLFVLATLIVFVATYEGYLSMLCAAGSIFGIHASFCKEDKPLRQLMAVGTLLWLFHNILAGSPGAVVMETLFLGSNVIGYFRYYVLPAKRILS